MSNRNTKSPGQHFTRALQRMRDEWSSWIDSLVEEIADEVLDGELTDVEKLDCWVRERLDGNYWLVNYEAALAVAGSVTRGDFSEAVHGLSYADSAECFVCAIAQAGTEAEIHHRLTALGIDLSTEADWLESLENLADEGRYGLHTEPVLKRGYARNADETLTMIWEVWINRTDYDAGTDPTTRYQGTRSDACLVAKKLWDHESDCAREARAAEASRQ